MTHQYTKLADWHQAMADEPKRNQAKREKHAETARILRAAAGVDVAGLMDVADRYALAQADPAHWRSALESDLRLVLAAREGWQPIETAPKDGTEVLLWPGIRHAINSVTPCAAGRYMTERSTMQGMWYDLGVGHHNGYWKPTHWMPLPTAPKGTP